MDRTIGEINAFTLGEVERGDSKAPRALLIHQGSPIGLTLEGATLEAQFAFGDEFLLLLTDDCPYEESLHIYLLDRDFHTIDRLDVGQGYAAGVLREVQVTGPDTMRFLFHPGAPYELRVHPEPRHILNTSAGLREMLRAGSKRRLEIRRGEKDG
ncbi:MAG: hypothetical protein HY820_05720 [Acidobacteria bacterium]|nr:hypothetical protein [Acidobacteriota bacterium]